MANPLTRSKPLTNPKTNPQEVQQTPIPDVYKPDYLIPGRGAVNHGVEIPQYSGFEPTVSYDDSKEAEAYEPYEKELAPIPVRLVDNGSRELRRFRTFKMTPPADGSPTSLLGRDENRTKVTINTDLDSGMLVAISDTREALMSAQGFRLAQVGSLTINTEDAIYFASTGTVPALPISVLVEYTQAIQK